MIPPPKLRSLEEEKERHATWLELFYDLVFVAVISQIGVMFHHHFNWQGFGEFVFLFIPIWWAWVGHTMYSNRFDTNDMYHRVITFFQMGAAAFLAASVQEALGYKSRTFAAAYVLIRLSLLMSYIRVYRHLPLTRTFIGRIGPGFAIGTGCWIASFFVESPLR